jgi:hypothetical protein
VQSADITVQRVQFLSQHADGCGNHNVVGSQPGLEPMKHATQLRQLPVHPRCLEAHTTDALTIIGRVLTHHVIFGAVELIANSVGELINYGIKKRYCRGKEFAALDRTPVAFDRMRGSLTSGNHHAFGHDKT